MNRGKDIMRCVPQGMVTFLAAYLGGGGAQNLTIPTDGVLKDDAAGLFPKRANHALAGTYASSTGVYTCTYISDMHLKHLLHCEPIVVSDGGAPTAALDAIVTKLTPATRTITIKVFAPNGTATDLGTSDLLILKITGWDSTG